MKKLVLASQSPRRAELLASLSYPFTCCPALGEEVMNPSLTPDKMVESLAQQKAREVLQRLCCTLDSEHDDGSQLVVIGSDTVVAIDGKCLGKPQDEEEAVSMILSLQGRTHVVYTGVCVCGGGKEETFFSQTQVEMRTLTEAEARAYVARGESMDKAGAYGIQSLGAWLIDRIQGDFYTVMGLPLCILGQVLPDFGIELFGNEGTG